MNAYTWLEGDGDRGANNITSCLYKDFAYRGFFNSRQYGDLTIIADNCGGQNKNKVVVRFFMWLMETKVFPRVRLFFLIKGHTKNACDRLFNLVKLDYHRKNVYTYDELFKTIDENEFITAHKMQREEFYNFEKWQDKYYRKPTGGEFNQTHVFTISSNNGQKPTIMVKQDIHGAIERIDDLIPNNRSRKAKVLPPQERAIALKNMKHDLEVLPNSGIKPIKQVELYKK